MANSITVQMNNGSTAATVNGINPKFKISNTGSNSVNLADVKLRYYYTVDGEVAQNFWCDYAAVNSQTITSKVTGTFVKISPSLTGADYYLEIGFKSDAGTLAAGAATEIQARFSKSDWSTYNQANDYSFNSSASQPVDWTKVTLYVGTSASPVWGTPPGGTPIPHDSTIEPTTATFDKNVAAQADIPVTMTLNGNTFVSITKGTALTLGTDYTVANNVVTMKKSYLATLPQGTAVLTFNFSAGKAQIFTITINDSTIKPVFELTVASASVKAGDSVVIPVTFKGVPVGYVDNCDFQLSYDTGIFDSVSIVASDITVNPSANFSSNVDTANGVVYVLYIDSTQDGTQAVKQDGVFANITLKAKGTAAAGTTSVKVKSLGGFTDKDLNMIVVTAANGVITIQ
jgi:hypothetical protein